MIKLNLLPAYIAEFRKMKMWGIVFAALFLVEAVVFLGWQSGIKTQTEWFKNDQARCTQLTQTYTKYKSDADALKANADAYAPWLGMFWALEPAKAVNDGIAKSMVEAATKLGGGKSAFNKMTLGADGTVSAQGRITGSLAFLDYYFMMEDIQFTLTPAVKVDFPRYKLNQQVELSVQGKVTPLPAPPALPGANEPWNALYQSAGSAAAGAAPAN